MLAVAGVERNGPWDTSRPQNSSPLLVETRLRLVGTMIPYNKRSYDTARGIRGTGKYIFWGDL